MAFLAISSMSFSYCQQTSFGLRTGFNLSRWTGEGSANLGLKLGYHAGLFVKAPVNDNVLFQPEVLLSLKGYTYNYATGFGAFTDRQTLYYIDVPLLIGVRLLEGFYFNLGLQPSFLVAARFKREFPDNTAYIDNSKRGFRKVGVDLLTGLDLTLSEKISLAGRFGYGLATVTENNNFTVRNFYFQLSIGYSF